MEVITGFHAIEEYIKSSKGRSVLYITGRNKRHADIALIAEKQGIKVVTAEQKELDRLSGGSENRGAVLVIQEKALKKIKYTSVKNFLDNFDREESIVLLLDGITDPHNFGAILRSADQLGIDLLHRVMSILEEAFGERFSVPPEITELYNKGEFGVKSGKGFYNYDR